MTKGSTKHLEDASHAHIVPLMYKLRTSNKGSDDLFNGFNRDRNRRRDELTDNKNIKGNFHLRIMLKDAFGFVEHQEKTTYGFGYRLTITRKKDDAVLDKAAGIADARIKIDLVIPHYTPSIQQQVILSKQFLGKTPTELRYNERTVFRKR